ncbi:MAG: hypothetical protein ABH862_00325 [Candidatus Omnitrophota bacterium]
MTKRGSILTVVLWLITTMALFGVGLARISRTAYSFSNRVRNDLIALNAIKAVTYSVMADRLNDMSPAQDSVSELSAENEYTAGDIVIKYSMEDEERKININKAPSSLLKELPSMDMDIAIEITSSLNKPFYPKEQVLVLDDMDEDIYNDIKDLITVYGEGLININTCGEEVLKIAGMDDALIGRIMEFRAGKASEETEEGGVSAGVFESMGSFLNDIQEQVYLTEGEKQELKVLIGKKLFTVKSNNYTIKASAYFKDKLIRKYSVTIGKKNSEKEYSIMEWREE